MQNLYQLTELERDDNLSRIAVTFCFRTRIDFKQ